MSLRLQILCLSLSKYSGCKMRYLLTLSGNCTCRSTKERKIPGQYDKGR